MPAVGNAIGIIVSLDHVVVAIADDRKLTVDSHIRHSDTKIPTKAFGQMQFLFVFSAKNDAAKRYWVSL